ncbi:MAG: hypothetical protein IKL46_03250 [Clostridia bacterium]|nr:hypothetical protein [Clostridia bacterium]
MTKKSMNKLLSVVLALAICFTTVFGCLITAGAADTNCCAKWSVGSASKDLDKATIYLAFTAVDEVAAEGFSAIKFALDSHADLSLQSIKAVATADGFASTALVDGSAVDVNDLAFEISSDKKGVIVESQNSEAYSTVVLEFTYGFVGGTAEQGATYDVSVKEIELGGDFAIHECDTVATGSIKASCDHVIAVKGDPINTDTINGYTVYENSYCTLCGEKFGYQLVPSTEPMNGTTIAWSAEGAYDDDLIDDADGEQDGSAEHPIIINSVEELYYLATMAGIDATEDKYFKLADGIDNVVLQSEKAALDIMDLKTAAEVNTYFTENGGYKWDSTVSQNVSEGRAATFAFAGNFDGNGATFYGLYDTLSDGNNDAAGLFPYVYVVDNDLKDTLLNDTSKINTSAAISAKTITISNINLKNSHLTGTFGMGFIIGKSIARANEHYDWAANIKNCSVVNNYMYANTGPANSVRLNGLIVGRLDSYMKYGSTWAGRATVNLNNCLVYGNSNATLQTDFAHGISVVGISHRGGTVKNSIILGTTPYLPNGAGENDINNGFAANRSTRSLYSNVYTDAPLSMKWQTKVEKVDGVNVATAWTTINYGVDGTAAAVMFSITDDSVLGVNAVNNCSNLDWGTTWSYGADGEYPSIASTGRSVIGWDNTKDTNLTDEKHSYSTQDGSIDNPIIIDSVAELYYLTRAGVAATANKHFKVADGIDTMVLQNAKYIQSIIDLEDAAQVKSYFSDASKISSPYQWYQTSWNSDPFAGYFDGNGVEIYGLCSNYASTAVAGLFPIVDTGATIKNLTLTNSYLNHTTKDNFDFGGLIGRCFNGGSDTSGSGLVVVENVAVINNYIFKAANEHTRAGIISGKCGNDTILIKNCLVYGNDAKYSIDSTTYDMTLRADIHNNLTAPQDYVDANPDYVYKNATYGWCYKAMVIDTIALDCLPYGAYHNGTGWALPFCFENVYTNSELVASANASEGTVEKWAKYVTVITTDDLSSAAAQKTAMPDLKWGTDWYANMGGYPTLTALDETRVATTSNGAFGLVAYNTTYKNDGSFDFNFYAEGQEGYDYVLYVGKTDNSGYTSFLKLEANDVTNPEIIAELGENAKVFSIGNLSSRDINTIWVPTIVATNGAVTEWGKSHQIALAQYAESVLNGEAIYADGTEESIKIADKKVAAALLNYADAATNALYAEDDVPTQKTKIVYYNGSGKGVEPTKGSGDSVNDPIIIETPENLLWILKEGKATTQKYYKVADNIKAFVLQPQYAVDSAGGIDELMSLDEQGTMRWFDDPNKTVTYKDDGGYGAASNTRVVNVNGKDVTWTNWDITTNSSSTPFMGHFDGNGVSIYGFYKNGGNPSLFGVLKGATIKNLNVKSSYIRGYSGGIIADASTGGSSYTNTIENCVIQNCCTISYRQSGKTDMTVVNTTVYNSMGAVVGSATSNLMTISNCLVSDMIAYNFGFDRTDGATSVAGQTVKDTYYYDTQGNINTAGWAVEGNTLAWLGQAPNSTNKYSNSIVLSVEPYSSTKQNYQNGTVRDDAFSNVYTDQISVNISWPNADSSKDPFVLSYAENKVKQITDLESLKGANAATTLALDWESGWMINNNAYPTPVQSGYIANEGKTLYWDGKKNSDTVLDDEWHSYSTQNGTAENPIIIDSAEELAYLASAGPTVSQFYNAEGTTYDTIFTGPKHFRIADGISKIVLQSSNYSEILELQDLEETRKYFAGETGVTGFVTWAGTGGWAAIDATTHDSFCGVFDGNGVEIYGIYMNGTGYGGLFGDMDGESAVKNVTVKNSYIHVSTAGGDHRAAAIVSHCDKAIAKQTGDTTKTTVDDGDFAIETITIENCKVENCHIGTPDLTERSGGATNCALLAANLTESKLSVNNCIVSNSEAYYDNDDTNVKAGLIGAVYGNSASSYSLKNSIILGVSAGSNRFTIPTNYNACFSNVYTDQATSYSTVTTVDNVNELKGSKAADIVSALNAANDKEVWYVGTVGDYPGFSKASALPSAYKAEYDALVPDKFNVSPTGGTENFGFYANSVNLRANPYLTFIFNFGEDYKTNRDDITVTFTYTVGGDPKTKTVSVPAYEEGKDLKADGWSNLAKSKKHTYQFTDLPIQGLVNGVSVVINYGDESVDCGTYSAKGAANAFTNANKKTPCSYYEVCAEAMKALVYYSQALTSRYGN